MSDVNIKLISWGDSRFYEQETSSYLLNVKVLDDLKEAIRQAKNASAATAENTGVTDH